MDTLKLENLKSEIENYIQADINQSQQLSDGNQIPALIYKMIDEQNQIIQNKASFIEQISEIFQLIKNDYLQRKKEKERIKAMKILRYSIMKFLITSFSIESKDNFEDLRLELLNDIIFELFEKIRDIYCVLESIDIFNQEILETLFQNYYVRSSILTQDFVQKLLKSISSPNLHVPSYNFKTRNTVYKIFEKITLNKQNLLSLLDQQYFIQCVLSSIEGEGDPRNLIIVFQLLSFLLSNYFQAYSGKKKDSIDAIQQETFLNDIFDKITAYFPINFEPPEDDKFKITPKQLKNELQTCIVSSTNEYWLENIFPFILDKMTAVQLELKIECLDIVDQLISFNKNEQNIHNHIEISLQQILNEYFNNFEDKLQIKCKGVIVSILKNLKNNKSNIVYKGTCIQEVQKYVRLNDLSQQCIQKCLQEIRNDPDGHQALLASQLLCNIIGNASTELTEFSADYILYDKNFGIITFLESIFMKEDFQQQQNLFNSYIQLLVNVLMAVNGINIDVQTNEQQELKKISISVFARQQIQLIIQQNIKENLKFFNLLFDKVLINFTFDSDILYEKTLKLFCQIFILQNSKEGQNQKIIANNLEEKYLNAILNKLFQNENNSLDSDQRQLRDRKSALNKIIFSQINQILKQVENKIKSSLTKIILECISQQKLLDAETLKDLFKNYMLQYNFDGLQFIIQNILTNQEIFQEGLQALENFNFDQIDQKQYDDIVWNLYLQKYFEMSNIQEDDVKSKIKLSKTIILRVSDNISSKILQNLIQYLELINQQQIDVPRLNEFLIIIKFLIKRKEGLSRDTQMIDNLLKQCILLAQNSNIQKKENFQKIPPLVFYIILRYNNYQQINEFSQKILESQYLENNLLSLITQITKAQVLKNQKIGFSNLDLIIKNYLNQDNFSQIFGDIMCKKVSQVVSKENGYLSINKMYSQRLFTHIFPLLKQNNNKQSLIIQMCSIVSVQFLQNQNILGELIPLAFETLTDKNSQIQNDYLAKSTALNLLKKILLEKSENLDSISFKGQENIKKDNIDLLIQNLINILKAKDEDNQGQEQICQQINLKVNCLFMLIQIKEQYPSNIIMNHNKKVIQALRKLLENKRRIIRKFARNCLNTWTIV